MRAPLAIALFLLALPLHAREVDFDPHPGARIPDVAFREGGLRDYLGTRPVVLVLGYEGCVNLCGTTLDGVSLALRDTGLSAGRDYTALFVSVDPRDEKAPREQRAGWHFLTGADSAAAVAKTVGFRYYYEEESGQFAHPAGFVVLTPQGDIARYFMGVRFDAPELRQAIAEAARGRTQGTFERVLLLCFHDPVSGKYTQSVLTGIRIAMIMLLAALGFVAWRKLR
jgi:protein SCO1/2